VPFFLCFQDKKKEKIVLPFNRIFTLLSFINKAIRSIIGFLLQGILLEKIKNYLFFYNIIQFFAFVL